jgi:fimbrial chaperone protein
MAPRWPHAGLLACALSLASAAAIASGLQISPVGLSLAPQQRADGIWLTNAGDTVMHAQVRVYRWTQEGDEDKLTPSKELVVSPPMVEIAPGDRQLVRAIRLGPPPGGPHAMEDAYRLVIDELPVNAEGRRGLSFVMRYSLPVFVTPASGTAVARAPQLTWAVRLQGEHVVIEVANGGGVHAQLAGLSFVDSAGTRTELHPGLLGYVLPMARMRWMLKIPPTAFAAGGTLEAQVNGEKAIQTLSPADRIP